MLLKQFVSKFNKPFILKFREKITWNSFNRENEKIDRQRWLVMKLVCAWK